MKQNKIIVFFLLVLGFFGMLLSSENVEGANILEAPNVSVPNENTIIPSKYDFIASFTKNTVVRTFGEGWSSTTKNMLGDFMGYTLLNPSDSLKGKTGVIYENVLMYKGKQIDLKITVEDWEQYNENTGIITYGKNSISHLITGYRNVKQTWEYVEHGTNISATEIKGMFMTINDIDSNQGVTFDKETSSNIEQMYVSSDSWIDYSNNNGSITLQEVNKQSSESIDEKAMITILFNSNKMTFEWGVDYAKRGTSSKVMYDNTLGGTEYFGYLAKKPAKTEVQTPTKKVSDENESEVNENTLQTSDESYSYTVYHNVPSEWESFYYKSFEFLDTLENAITLKDVKVFNESNKDVTNYFDNLSNGQSVKLVAKASTLKNVDFYGNTYKFVISVQPTGYDNLMEFFDSNKKKAKISNVAKIVVDGMSKTSNVVNTNIPVVKAKISKKVAKLSDEVGTGHIDVDYKTDYKYTINADFPSTSFKEAVIEDKLENVLTHVETKVYDDSNKDITDYGTLTTSNNDVKWTVKEPNKVLGKSVKMVIKSNVKEKINLDSYIVDNRIVIPNIATLSVDADVLKSEAVTVTPPKQVKASIQKFVRNSSGELLSEGNVGISENYTYVTDVTVPNDRELSSLILYDDLEDVLEPIGAKILNGNKEDVTKDGVLSIDKKTGVVKWTAKEPLKYATKKLSLEITAKVKKDANLSDYLVDGKIVIPNVSKLIINDEEKPSNNVPVTLPEIKTELNKKIVKKEVIGSSTTESSNTTSETESSTTESSNTTSETGTSTTESSSSTNMKKN